MVARVIPISDGRQWKMRECVTFKCSHCKSERVVKDADVGWDVVTQSWTVRTVFETATCLDCGTDTRLESEVIS